jgi:hypothetical protein
MGARLDWNRLKKVLGIVQSRFYSLNGAVVKPHVGLGVSNLV